MGARSGRWLVLACVLAFLTAWPGAQAATAPGAEVYLQNSAFAPATLMVNANDTVTWTNKDAYAHDVTFEAGFGSGAAGGLRSGDAWSWNFTSVGVYRYRCVVHSSSYGDGMVGVVTVVASGAPPPAPPGGSPGQSGGGGMGGMNGGMGGMHGGMMTAMWSWMAMGMVFAAVLSVLFIGLIVSRAG